ncbi:MAG: hypothetical protein ACRDKE_08190 [Solirubrobacterales bacterium]
MSHEEFIDEVSTGATTRPEVDSIWLTRPSVKPIVLALAFLFTLIGLFAFPPLMFVGLVAIAWVSIAWIGDSRVESDELPLS